MTERTSLGDRAERALRAYLRQAPFAAAIWRSNEATALAQVPLPRPTLDIGCGFGEFGRIFVGDGPPIDVGIDIDRSELFAARDAPYRALIQCDARRIPLDSGTFASVFSISTLEHIPDVERAFTEAARVLRPGGVLAFTVPLARLTDNFLGGRALRLVSARAARWYADRVNRMLTHVNVWPAERWISLVEGAGLRVEETRTHISPAATMAFELLLPAAYASRKFKDVTGRRIPHPDLAVRAIEPLARRLVTPEADGGSNLLVVARKP